MKNKTCGECHFYHPIWKHEGVCTATSDLRKTCDFTTGCAVGGVYLKPPPTNGDRIRQMSNEELAEWFALGFMCDFCPMCDECTIKSCTYKYCREKFSRWLNALVESEGEDE